jgi:hypothetical protein
MFLMNLGEGGSGCYASARECKPESKIPFAIRDKSVMHRDTDVDRFTATFNC